MSWQAILKSYELPEKVKDFIYRTEIKPNMYEFLPEANDSVREFKDNDPERFELYLSDIFDYLTSKVSKEEMIEFYREMYYDDDFEYDPMKIRMIIYEGMKLRKP